MLFLIWKDGDLQDLVFILLSVIKYIFQSLDG